jgi:glycosyltransferase involved in cell wall biosynthesis
VWTFAPDVHFLRGALGEESFVYYCVDEYTKFQGFDSDAMTRLESRLLHCADLVITTSKPLWDAKRKIRADAELVPHGVDYDHFAKAWREPPAAPADLRDVRRPIFGFFGLIHHWFDVQLVAQVAKLRPDYSFVLIGDCKVDSSKLNLPNVHLLGRKDYSTLPAYCAAFSAGLLPFVRNALTQCVNPIKLTEYLAAGLPVAATAIPAAQDFGGPVAIANSAEELAAACDAALQYGPADRPRISEAVRAHTWEARVETVSDLVLRTLRRAPRPEVHPQTVNAAVRSGYWQPFERIVSHPAN